MANDFLDALKRNSLYLLPNSGEELRQIDRFEAAYNRIDKHLRKELGIPRNPPTFAGVVRQYAQQNPEWQSEKELLRLGGVRNNLRHDLTDVDQYRMVPSVEETHQIENIARWLRGDEPEEHKQQSEEHYETEHNEAPEDEGIEPTTVRGTNGTTIPEEVVNIRGVAVARLACLADVHRLITEAMRRADWHHFTTPEDVQNLLRGTINPLIYTSQSVTDIEFLAKQVDVSAGKMARCFAEGLKKECLKRTRALVACQNRLRKKQEEFSAQWYEAEKKRLNDLKRNKKINSGLTPKSIFYGTSEEYVTHHLKPTIAQNIQDQFDQSSKAIETKRQQSLPPLEEEVRLAAISLQKVQESLEWINRAIKYDIKE